MGEVGRWSEAKEGSWMHRWLDGGVPNGGRLRRLVGSWGVCVGRDAAVAAARKQQRLQRYDIPSHEVPIHGHALPGPSGEGPHHMDAVGQPVLQAEWTPKTTQRATHRSNPRRSDMWHCAGRSAICLSRV